MLTSEDEVRLDGARARIRTVDEGAWTEAWGCVEEGTRGVFLAEAREGTVAGTAGKRSRVVSRPFSWCGSWGPEKGGEEGGGVTRRGRVGWEQRVEGSGTTTTS